MKNLFLLFIAFPLFQYTTYAQEGWIQQTSGTTSNLWSVYFTDQNTGWVVGESATILKTTTGGVVSVEEQQLLSIPVNMLLRKTTPTRSILQLL